MFNTLLEFLKDVLKKEISGKKKQMEKHATYLTAYFSLHVISCTFTQTCNIGSCFYKMYIDCMYIHL